MREKFDIQTTSPIRILTAANQPFARTLWQFLKSAQRLGLHKSSTFVAYDLGLNQSTIEHLHKSFPWCTFKRFRFEDYPPHVAMHHRNFAWKPLIIAEEFLNHDGIVFWFDSAVIFRSNLDKALERIATDGMWYLRGKSRLESRANPSALDKMLVPLEVRHLPEISAGSIGFSTNSELAKQIVRQWRDFACKKDVIAESDQAYICTADGKKIWHQFDQSLLSGLVLSMVYTKRLRLRYDEVDISSANPIRFISTRNKVKPGLPFWADMASRFYYLLYKFCDRTWLGFIRKVRPLAGGFQRWRKEHYVVTVQNKKTGLTRNIPSPTYGYYADPFIWQKNGTTWLFVEEYQHSKDLGRLVALELDENLKVLQKLPLEMAPEFGKITCHASFPFLFQLGDELCMIPETCARRSVDLYTCERWPDQWKLKRRLLFGLDAADTMAIEFKGLWWLFTSVRDSSGARSLHIYSLQNLTSDTPKAHPINSQNLYQNEINDTGRGGGTLRKNADGTLMRFAQNSKHHYGEGGRWKRIEVLDEQNFKEVDVAGSDVEHHHHTDHSELATWDRRTRAK